MTHKATLKTPEQYKHLIEDLREIKRDQQNPNVMTKRKKQRVWKSLSEFGWVFPIVTDLNGLLADGEQRVDVCLEHGEFYGPVLKLDIKDVDRRLLRQVLNKLRGEHDLVLDALEFERIIKLGDDTRLKELIVSSDRRMQSYLNLIRDQPLSNEVLKEAAEKFKTITESTVLDRSREEQYPREPLTLACKFEFLTKSDITDRTLAVCEAFGLGVDEERLFPVFSDFKLAFHRGDLIYVTGDSGGGKTLLLNAFKKFFGEEAAGLCDVQVSPEETLVEGVGETVSEAVKTLSMTGLNDAFLFLRKFKELSDGQKYRYRLAKLIDQKEKSVWVIDEFCATLDRVMARVVAYLIQKVARKLHKTVVVATTHRDLIEDFKPDIIVKKGFERDVEIEKGNKYDKKVTILNEVVVKAGSIEDYHKLSRFHYLPHSVAGVQAYFKLVFRGDLVGVIVYANSPLQLSGRNKVFGDRYASAYMDFKTRELLNKEVTRVARIVIHPKFRGVGLGARLVRETLPKVGFKVVEVVASMAKYNPVFEHAGMVRVDIERKLDPATTRLKNLLEQKGFDFNFLYSRKYCRDFYYKQDVKTRQKIIRHLRKLGRHPSTGFVKGDQVVAVERLTRLIPRDTVYLYWINQEKVQQF